MHSNTPPPQTDQQQRTAYVYQALMMNPVVGGPAECLGCHGVGKRVRVVHAQLEHPVAIIGIVCRDIFPCGYALIVEASVDFAA